MQHDTECVISPDLGVLIACLFFLLDPTIIWQSDSAQTDSEMRVSLYQDLALRSLLPAYSRVLGREQRILVMAAAFCPGVDDDKLFCIDDFAGVCAFWGCIASRDVA